MGSDHCPIFWESSLQPHHTDLDNVPPAPALCSLYFEEVSGRQRTLVDFFQKRGTKGKKVQRGEELQPNKEDRVEKEDVEKKHSRDQSTLCFKPTQSTTSQQRTIHSFFKKKASSESLIKSNVENGKCNDNSKSSTTDTDKSRQDQDTIELIDTHNLYPEQTPLEHQI
jgi:hypothetical protein